jgi:hypothetical protein
VKGRPFLAHFERLKRFEGRPGDLQVDDEGEIILWWGTYDDKEIKNYLVTTADSGIYQGPPYASEQFGSHASNDERLSEPDIPRQHYLRDRIKIKSTWNPNFIT